MTTMIGTSERGAQLAAHVEAVAVGQAEVEQHDVERRWPRSVERVAAGLDPVDLEALALEALGQRRGDGVVVLDDQYSHAAALSVGPAAAALSEVVDRPRRRLDLGSGRRSHRFTPAGHGR